MSREYKQEYSRLRDDSFHSYSTCSPSDDKSIQSISSDKEEMNNVLKVDDSEVDAESTLEVKNKEKEKGITEEKKDKILAIINETYLLVFKVFLLGFAASVSCLSYLAYNNNAEIMDSLYKNQDSFHGGTELYNKASDNSTLIILSAILGTITTTCLIFHTVFRVVTYIFKLCLDRIKSKDETIEGLSKA